METQTLSNEPIPAVIAAPISPPDSRTVNDLKKNGYKGLDAKFTKDILYLEQLSSTTSQPITAWPVIEMLKNVKRNDKRAINKLFFDHITTEKKEVLGELDSDTFQKIERVIFDRAMRQKENELHRLRGEYENTLASISNYQRDMKTRIRTARERFERIGVVEGLSPETSVRGFREILKNPFWKFERFAISKAYFVTSNEVVMRYVHTNAGIDYQANFGKLRIVLDLQNTNITALKCENNLVATTRNYHPYISSSGDICFGTAGDSASRMLIEAEYGKLFDLLAALLVTYDGNSSPYISLGDFVSQEQRGKAVRETPKLCKTCSFDEDHCTCPWCDVCRGVVGHTTHDCEKYCRNCGTDNTKCDCSKEEEEEEFDNDEDEDNLF